MSQMVTRKGPLGDDKEKVQTDSPVKDMKKKVAANAEKEKQAAEKHTEKDKDKDKTAEKHPEKGDKNAEKTAEKKDKGDKSSDKKEKNVDKEKGDKGEKADKVSERKSEAPAEKPKEDKNAKPDKPDDKEKDKKSKAAPDTPKPKQNGARANGLPTATAEANGDHSDATVSSDEEMVIDHERDDMFPELAYEDSDGEFEPPTPEGLPSRSYTRRSQAKATRTPETPRPASDKRADAADDSKESKILKLKDDTPTTDRKLRSSDSPKPEAKRAEKVEKKGEKEKETAKEETKAGEKSPKKKDLEAPEAKGDGNVDKSAVDVVIDLDVDEEPKSQEPRKADTNYSRSRVKVSPYRRAKADLTASSVVANYTGNNTTMEMDITESSSFVTEETPAMDSPYLLGLRSIRGRRSYKPLKEMALRNISVNRSVHSTSTTSISVTEQPSRPTAPVVGRKRKPEGEESSCTAAEALELEARGKRARLLQRLARPFRAATSTPPPARRNAEIVGINTDLPLTAPVATPDTFDPESLKLTSTPLATPLAAPLTPPPEQERDARSKCIVM